MNNDPLGPKDPEKIKTIKFPFARELGGATIASVTSVTPSTFKGVDPSPGAVVMGGPVISGTDVLQRMQGGLDGVVYKWRAKVVDSNGNTHVATALVLVKTL